MAKIRIQKGTIPVSLTIDGHSLEATVTRFTAEQASEFRQNARRTQLGRAEAMLLKRREGEGWNVPDAEIRRRRLLEMTDTERSEHARVLQEDEAAALAFVVKAVSDHLRLAPGQVQIVDESTNEARDVVTGEEFVRTFGGRHDILLEALAVIAAQREDPPAPTSPAETQP